MWYDFSNGQTWFEGDVSLKYFCGGELARIRGEPAAAGMERLPGRATFLTCDVLTVDFLDREERSRRSRRMGRLSVDQLRQFQASGSVVLQDVSEGLSLTADRVVYWRDRNLLAVYGSERLSARIVTQKPAQLPNQVTVDRLFYDLNTGRMEMSKPTLTAR